MKPIHLLVVILISAVTTLITALYLGPVEPRQGSFHAPIRESAYARVMRTGTLRCGYVLYPKTIERDLNTGKMSGPMYAIMEEMGKTAWP